MVQTLVLWIGLLRATRHTNAAGRSGIAQPLAEATSEDSSTMGQTVGLFHPSPEEAKGESSVEAHPLRRRAVCYLINPPCRAPGILDPRYSPCYRRGQFHLGLLNRFAPSSFVSPKSLIRWSRMQMEAAESS